MVPPPVSPSPTRYLPRPNTVGVAVTPSRLTRGDSGASLLHFISPHPDPVSNRRILGAEERYHLRHHHRDDRRSATSPLSTSPVTPLGADSEHLVGWSRD
ncbi:hypothetical protein V501_04466 [Pseudogymnoascus sp. VKM F-4519 (FW-2642)]|nr:hypothetical protein V501_04466 [Pseudogymnoascus sp. VKM F-4519 (FW-2642)]